MANVVDATGWIATAYWSNLGNQSNLLNNAMDGIIDEVEREIVEHHLLQAANATEVGWLLIQRLLLSPSRAEAPRFVLMLGLNAIGSTGGHSIYLSGIWEAISAGDIAMVRWLLAAIRDQYPNMPLERDFLRDCIENAKAR